MNVRRYWRALREIHANVQRIRPLSTTAWEAWVFCVARKIKRGQGFPFRFKVGPYLTWARPADFFAVEEVLLEYEYDFAARVMAQAIRSPTVVDGGANIGLFSLAMLLVQPNAVIHSLEPGAHTFQILRRNAKANPVLNWQVYPLALWKASGPLNFGATATSTSSRIYDLAPEGQIEVVQAITLTEFIAQHVPDHITLLKIDIEGAEEAVLAEGESVLGRVDNLVVEIHPPRANEARVMGILHAHFPYVYRVPGRRSGKPLILASRTHTEFPQ